MNIDDLYNKQKNFTNSQKKIEVKERIHFLKKLKNEILKREEEIFTALEKDLNKPRFEAYATEIGYLLNEIDLFINNLKSWSKPRRVNSTLINFPSKDFIIYEPYGLILIISPWNYPFQLALLPAMSAFAAGNNVILKPSEHTSNTSALIKSIVSEVFPEELISVIEGGAETASKLLDYKWDYIFFTGSVRIGKIVAKAAANNLTPITLELGGKSPAIIDKKIDIKLVSKRIVWGKFLNSGQTCIAPDYLIIHKSIKDKFINQLIYRIKYSFGESSERSKDLTSIINENHFERLVKLIEENEVIYGGEYDSKLKFIYPTIVNNPSLDSNIMREEIFGPILPILTYENIKEIDEIINKNPNPLSLYLFSNDNDLTENIINRYSFGGGAINDTIVHLANSKLPFGGIGNSGTGSYHGKSSFDLFSHKKSIVKKGNWYDNNLRYAPYKNKLNLLKRLMKYLR